MPYIVTTFELVPTGVEHMGAVETTLEPVSRRAVATLEEARNEAEGYRSLAYDLPESGGTVGLLPDGTVIEVEQVTWRALGGERVDASTHEKQRTTLDAYNARQAEHGT